MSSESLIDQQRRLKQEALKNQYKRWGVTVLFSLALLTILLIIVILGLIVINPNTEPTKKKWATVLITSITTGLLGYLAGKAT